jgi:hypothetical protein
MKGQTERMLTDYEMSLIRETESNMFFKTMLDKVEVIDTVFNPTGILKHIDKYFAQPHIGERQYNADGFFSLNMIDLKALEANYNETKSKTTIPAAEEKKDNTPVDYKSIIDSKCIRFKFKNGKGSFYLFSKETKRISLSRLV